MVFIKEDTRTISSSKCNIIQLHGAYCLILPEMALQMYEKISAEWGCLYLHMGLYSMTRCGCRKMHDVTRKVYNGEVD